VHARGGRAYLAQQPRAHRRELERNGPHHRQRPPATFGLKHVRGVDGQIYAQPLYVSGLVFPNNGNPINRNVVYVATEHDSVYAFDATSGARLWRATLLNTHFGETPVPADDTGSTDSPRDRHHQHAGHR
jgi:hypothetical protein